jgi:RNA polymerase sigma-70 factor (ECF subfamily)
MDSITRTLWLQARAGDEAAYDRLFALHADRALLFIRARLGAKLRSSLESRDVLQEVYLAAHEAFPQFDYTDEAAFTRWLCRIAENRIRDLDDYFSARKRQAVDLPAANPATGPVTALDRIERRETLLKALDELSDDHRSAILLRYFEGLSAEETGQRMGRTAGAVRKLTARALAELGERL